MTSVTSGTDALMCCWEIGITSLWHFLVGNRGDIEISSAVFSPENAKKLLHSILQRIALRWKGVFLEQGHRQL